jgi:ribonuclease J
MGVAAENIFVMENGDVLELDGESAGVRDKVMAGYVYVDGLVGDVGQVVLRDRKALSQEGIFVVVVAVDKQSGRVVGSPDIVSRGFIDMRESGDLLDATKQVVLDALAADRDHVMDWSRIHARVKDAVSQYLYEQTRRRPMVLPVALEV